MKIWIPHMTSPGLLTPPVQDVMESPHADHGGPHARLTSHSIYPAPVTRASRLSVCMLVLVVPVKVHGAGLVGVAPSVHGCGPDIGPFATSTCALTLKSKKPLSFCFPRRNRVGFQARKQKLRGFKFNCLTIAPFDFSSFTQWKHFCKRVGNHSESRA